MRHSSVVIPNRKLEVEAKDEKKKRIDRLSIQNCMKKMRVREAYICYVV